MDGHSPRRTRSATAASRNICQRHGTILTEENSCPRCNQEIDNEEIIVEPAREVLGVINDNAAQAATATDSVVSNMRRTRSSTRRYDPIAAPRNSRNFTNIYFDNNEDRATFNRTLVFVRNILNTDGQQSLAVMLTPRLSGNVTQNIPTVHISQDHVDSNFQCSICYENYKINEEVKKLICDHMFHDVCITPWLRRRPTCPLCRRFLGDQELLNFGAYLGIRNEIDPTTQRVQYYLDNDE